MGPDSSAEDIVSLVSNIDASGSGELRVLVDNNAQASLVFEGLLQNNTLSGATAPEIVVQGSNGTNVTVDLEKIVDAKIAYSIESLRVDLEGLNGATWTEGDYRTLKALSDGISALQTAMGGSSVSSQITAAIGTKSVADNLATSGVNEAAPATGLWAGIESAIAAAVTSLEGKITALETKITGGTITATQYDTLKEISDALAVLNGAAAGSVSKSISDAIGAPSVADDPNTAGDQSVAATGLFLQVEELIAAAVSTLQTQINAINTNTDGVTLNSIAELKAAVEALQTATGGTSVSSQISTALTNLINSVLAGPGAIVTVDGAATAFNALPDLVANYRLVDTAAKIQGIALPSTLVSKAKAVIVNDNAALTSADVTALTARGVDWSASSYSLTGTAAQLTALDPDVLNGATNLTVTGNTNFAQASELLAADNSGTTTLANLVVNSAEARALQFDDNDVVTKATITGSHC